MYALEQVSVSDLKRADLFAGLPDQCLESLARVCSLRHYDAGQRCATQGRVIDEIGIINRGKASVEVRIEVPPYTQALNTCTLTTGNVFTWSALIEPRVPTASVRCVEAVQAIFISAAHMQALFAERPTIERIVMRNLLKIMDTRLAEMRRQLARLVAELIKREN